MADFIRLIRCPVTKKIFKIPVMASDNIVYEAEIAFKLINTEEKSPISGLVLEQDIKIIITLKSMISLFLEKFQEYKVMQYNSDFDISKIYHFSKAEILSVFTERDNYDRLLKYDKFKIDDIDYLCFTDFLRYCGNHEVIIHFLDRCNNLNYKWGNSSWNLVNYIFKYASPEVVKYVLKTYKELDYENDCSNGWRPIHQIASSYDGECVRLIVDLGVNVLNKTSENISALEYIVGHHDMETIKHVIDKVNFLDDLSLPILLVRMEDNEKLNEFNKDELRAIMITKFNF